MTKKHIFPKNALCAPQGPSRAEYILFGVIAAAFYFLFGHPDLLETARHSYILIRSTLNGNFFGFYEDVFQRVYSEYYFTNAAHYNILMYILYALWELPLYLAERIGGFAFSDLALALWCKAIGTGFYLGCGFFMARLARGLGCSDSICRWMPLFFWLNPISFFTTLTMGQYDSICLFFTLWALCEYFDGRMLRFSFIIGVGVVFKFFPLLIFAPLVLLAEKRPVRIIQYGLCGLWLFVPTSLLFAGRTGDASFFTSEMLQRVLQSVFPGGMMPVSRILLFLVLVCCAAFLYRPADDAVLRRTAIYGALAIFSVLFLLIHWHPQWLILLVPFALLAIMMQRQKLPWCLLHIAFCIGYFCLIFFQYPQALEGNLFDFGILVPITGTLYALMPTLHSVNLYLNSIPFSPHIVSALFHAPLVCMPLFFFPLRRGSIGDLLSGRQEDSFLPRLFCWGCFAAGFLAVWCVPSVYSYGRTVGWF